MVIMDLIKHTNSISIHILLISCLFWQHKHAREYIELKNLWWKGLVDDLSLSIWFETLNTTLAFFLSLFLDVILSMNFYNTVFYCDCFENSFV
jgi:hypothetical protein